jgi:DNA-binding transcriptional LysR family regulator
LQPILADFLAEHPKIRVELAVSTTMVNLIESGIDLAIRVESPKDSDLIYRKLAPNDLVMCASPKYLKSHPRPIKKPQDLAHHSLLMLSIHNRCRFVESDIRLGDFANRQRVVCDSGEFLTDFALNDGGVLVRSVWDVQHHIKSGKLVQLLSRYPLETFGHIYAVIPTKRFLAPRVKVFLDTLLKHAEGWEHPKI